jgi:microcystin-dependent protein
MARNYSSISEVKTLAANVPETGAGSTQVIFNEGTTGLPAVPFVLVLNPDTSNEEVVLAISLSGSTYTVTRNIEGGGVKSHTVNQEVRHMIVGSDLQLVHNHLDNTTTAHGVTGEVVGTTKEQTLTLKRLNAPKINENVNLTATSTELNRVVGVTSAIQTQIDTKAPSAGPTFTGTVVLPSTTSIGTVSATEIGYLDGTTSGIQAQLNALEVFPKGMIVPFAGASATVPTGWLLCDGSVKSRTTYAALWDVLRNGTSSSPYGNGDGSTTFNLPDLRGRIPMGAGTGRNVADSADLTARTLGAKVSDAETHTLTSAEIPAHSHPNTVSGTFAAATHYHGVNSRFTASYLIGNGFYYTEGSTVVNNGTTNTGANDSTASVSITNANNTGGGGAHNNIQPSTVVNFIIKH